MVRLDYIGYKVALQDYDTTCSGIAGVGINGPPHSLKFNLLMEGIEISYLILLTQDKI